MVIMKWHHLDLFYSLMGSEIYDVIPFSQFWHKLCCSVFNCRYRLRHSGHRGSAQLLLYNSSGLGNILPVLLLLLEPAVVLLQQHLEHRWGYHQFRPEISSFMCSWLVLYCIIIGSIVSTVYNPEIHVVFQNLA